MVQERLDLITIIAQQPDDILGRAVPQPNPDHLRRRSEKDAQSLKILILAYQHKFVVSRILPNRKIGSAEQTNIADVDGVRIDIGNRPDKAGSKVFVE
ncbi:MAG TPA: hypothetical protein VFC56_01400 [Stellaceae bacterium]|nr:hypothetical protein [Stellaceae bacterium]